MTDGSRDMNLDSLPGADLVARGWKDLAAGHESVESLLVQVGAPRLRQLGIIVSAPASIEPPEHRLSDLLARTDADGAHARYNALIRRLVSFEHAAECVRE
jgi:hypothetical protein